MFVVRTPTPTYNNAYMTSFSPFYTEPIDDLMLIFYVNYSINFRVLYFIFIVLSKWTRGSHGWI